jgi:hypothetical protein
MGIGRLFKIFDDDGSKTLCLPEFKKAMTDIRVGLTDREIERLFKIFDTNQGG